jgi:uncharacterized membrane protein (DUF485 family)
MSDASEAALEALAAKRLRIGAILTVAELIVYFGFILLVAFNKGGLSVITPGLSVGIPLGVLVILATWVLTWVYVGWANKVYEPEIARLKG